MACHKCLISKLPSDHEDMQFSWKKIYSYRTCVMFFPTIKLICEEIRECEEKSLFEALHVTNCGLLSDN